ncbi:TPR repeat-containing protein [Croceitalea dokdonensis DOKDO 023]|uniref:TPR repeat-containing protein n=1 Tax=Croceitalea dokdonensis DOKDO 023 TaxID=1300341 RepID=A0A0N8H4F9_9FLAO|nr:tetratricopeptide repeat protein [Croceitalea dokdonensis]KPM33260.1 TPR repeat-containing protein [Croceitalea dokdonensis DOKDO 023]
MKRRCLGLTSLLNLKRCKRNVDGKNFYCDDHKRQPIYYIFFLILIPLAVNYSPKWFQSNESWQYPEKETMKVFTPIFNDEDSTSLNILILRFEDFVADKNTYCIGRTIEDILNTDDFQNDRSLNVFYADSILSPKNLYEARIIEEKHNADLVIFGLVNDIKNNCEEAQVCYRYQISESLVKSVISPIELKGKKFDRSFQSVIPSQLDNTLSFDNTTLKSWVIGLYSIKKGETYRTLIEIDKVVGNHSLPQKTRSERLAYFGQTFIQIRQDSLAYFALEKSMKLDSVNPISYLFLSRLQFLNRRYDKAEEILKKGLNITDNSAWKSKFYLDLAKLYVGTIEPREILRENPTNFTELHHNLNTKNENARFFFNKAIEVDSLNAEAFLGMGIHELHNSPSGFELMFAGKYFDKFMALKPELKYLVYSNLGVYYSVKGNYSKSLEYHEKAIRQNSTDYNNYIMRQNVFRKIKDFESAINDLNIAITLESNNYLAYQQLAMVYKGLGDFNQAENQFIKAIYLNENNPLPRLNLGELYYNQRDLARAEKVLLEAKKLDVRNDWLRIDLLLDQIQSTKIQNK